MKAEPFTSQADYDSAVEALAAADREYYLESGESTMMDYEYDTLKRRKHATDEVHPEWVTQLSLDISTKVAGGQSSGGDLVHSVPMLSLDNAMDEDEFRAWADRLAKSLGETADTEYAIEPKLDGLALVATYEGGNLVSIAKRGDGYSGEDVTDRVRGAAGMPQTLPEPLDLEVRGECVFTTKQYEEANLLRIASGKDAYANARNAVAGAVARLYSTYKIEFTFAAYALVGPEAGSSHSKDMSRLRSLGFETAAHLAGTESTVLGVEAAVKVINDIENRRSTLGFDIDGAVVKADLRSVQDKAGSTSKAPRWAIARKYPADTAVTLLEDIDYEVGRTGKLTPRAVLSPVFVGGTTVKYATLHNEDQINRLGVRIGDYVITRRAGEVIPEVMGRFGEHSEGSVEFHMPTHCPSCGTELDRSQVDARCPNADECAIARILEYFVGRSCMDVEGLGTAVIEKLIEYGLVNDAADLYTLDIDTLSSLNLSDEPGKVRRLGKPNAEKILQNLENSKDKPLSKVFAGLGIRLTGGRMSLRIARHFGTMSAIRSATVDELAEVEGMGLIKAQSVIAGLQRRSEVIDRLIAHGVNMTEPTVETVSNESPLTGKAVVVSGTVPGLSRSEAQEWVEKLGGKATSSVSKNTDLLVAGDGAGSKVAKANSLGVAIMDAREFAQIVAEHS